MGILIKIYTTRIGTRGPGAVVVLNVTQSVFPYFPDNSNTPNNLNRIETIFFKLVLN